MGKWISAPPTTPTPSTGTDDATLTSVWYTGSFSVDIDSTPPAETLDFVVIDPDSDGVYTVLNFDADDSGSYSAAEVFTSSPGSVTVGGTPSLPNSVTLAAAVTPGGGAGAPGLPTAAEVIEILEDDGELTDEEVADEEEENGEEEEDPPQFPVEVVEPPPERVTRDAFGQRLVVDEVVVHLNLGLKMPNATIQRIAESIGAQIIGSIQETRTYQLRFEVSTARELEIRQAALLEFPEVDSASRHLDNGLSRVTSDAQYATWDTSTPAGKNWNLEFIGAAAAWDITTGSHAARVGVIDADFDRDHADLRSNIALAAGDRTEEAQGHGTHVAGTACAEGDNSLGISGVSWRCTLLLYDFGGSSAVTAQQAMVAAINQGASVINMSLQWIDNGQCGAVGSNDTIKKVAETNAILGAAVLYAREKRQEVLFVFAAGNGCRDTRFASPASLVVNFPDNVIVVGSIDISGNLSSFSNRGNLVDVAAPGGQIHSTLPGSAYGELSGTSMATPHVTGLAALMKSSRPDLSAAQIKRCIVGSAQHQMPGQPFRVINAPAALTCNPG